jgi:hypothetical protein
MRGTGANRQGLAEALRFVEVHPVERELIPFTRRGRGFPVGKFADDTSPLTLRHFELRDPEPLAQSDVDLRFIRAMARFVRRASHEEAARRAPTELDGFDITRLARGPAIKGIRSLQGDHRSRCRDGGGTQRGAKQCPARQSGVDAASLQFPISFQR